MNITLLAKVPVVGRAFVESVRYTASGPAPEGMNISCGMRAAEGVIIAGGFGAHVKTTSLVGLGLVPAELSQKVRFIGNSAKSGALMCLLSHEERTRMEALTNTIQYLSYLPLRIMSAFLQNA